MRIRTRCKYDRYRTLDMSFFNVMAIGMDLDATKLGEQQAGKDIPAVCNVCAFEL